MAYMDQEGKQALSAGIKAVLKRYGCKGSLSVRHNSGLVCKLSSGDVDFKSEYIGNRQSILDGYDVNVYSIPQAFTGKAAAMLLELKTAMNIGNHDRSDTQSDYFDIGWYTYITIGHWDKDYICTK